MTPNVWTIMCMVWHFVTAMLTLFGATLYAYHNVKHDCTSGLNKTLTRALETSHVPWYYHTAWLQVCGIWHESDSCLVLAVLGPLSWHRHALKLIADARPEGLLQDQSKGKLFHWEVSLAVIDCSQAPLNTSRRVERQQCKSKFSGSQPTRRSLFRISQWVFFESMFLLTEPLSVTWPS